MLDIDQLAGVVEDLIDVMHTQTKALQKLVERIEPTTTRLEHSERLSTSVTELSDLYERLKELRRV
jgi:hypothetical protein